jgi:hypothetical protein
MHWFLRYLQAVRWEELLKQVDDFAVLQALVLVARLALGTLPSFWLDEMPAIPIGPDGPSYANRAKREGKASQVL